MTSPLINSSFLMVCFFPRFNCWAIIGFSSFSWTVGNLLNSVYALQVAHTFGLHNQPSLRSPVFSWDHWPTPSCEEKMPKGGWLDVTDPRRPPLWMTCDLLPFWGDQVAAGFPEIKDILWLGKLGLVKESLPGQVTIYVIYLKLYANTIKYIHRYWLLILIFTSKHLCQVSAS